MKRNELVIVLRSVGAISTALFVFSAFVGLIPPHSFLAGWLNEFISYNLFGNTTIATTGILATEIVVLLVLALLAVFPASSRQFLMALFLFATNSFTAIWCDELFGVIGSKPSIGLLVMLFETGCIMAFFVWPGLVYAWELLSEWQETILRWVHITTLTIVGFAIMDSTAVLFDMTLSAQAGIRILESPILFRYLSIVSIVMAFAMLMINAIIICRKSPALLVFFIGDLGLNALAFAVAVSGATGSVPAIFYSLAVAINLYRLITFTVALEI